MRPKLYLETTIPSVLVARPSGNDRIRSAQIDTKLWWETRRSSFEMFVSQVVLAEISKGETVMAADRFAVVRGLEVLVSVPDSEELTARLLGDGIVPEAARDDAAHIARRCTRYRFFAHLELQAHQQPVCRTPHRKGLRSFGSRLSRHCNSDGIDESCAMNEEDDILSEIRRIRDAHARSQSFDVHALFEEMRRDEARLKAEGWKFADFSRSRAEAVVREEPPRS